MNITVLKIFSSKENLETVFFFYDKMSDNSAFREAINRESLKYDLNNIEYVRFNKLSFLS